MIEAPTVELVPVVRSVTIAQTEWECLKDQAKMFCASGLLPKAIQKPEQAMVIMMKGRELGLPPMTSLSSIYLVEGAPFLAADLMKALVLRDCKGAKIRTVKFDESEAIVEMSRPGIAPFQYRYTMEEAKRANLTGKNNWKNHPQLMLLHRATAIGCRDMFPDVVLGCYIPDEAEEIRASAEARDVTPESSAQALAERLDYLPGVEPKATAEQFCENLKGIPNAGEVVQAQLSIYHSQKDEASYRKLAIAAAKAEITTEKPSATPEPEKPAAAAEKEPVARQEGSGLEASDRQGDQQPVPAPSPGPQAQSSESDDERAAIMADGAGSQDSFEAAPADGNPLLIKIPKGNKMYTDPTLQALLDKGGKPALQGLKLNLLRFKGKGGSLHAEWQAVLDVLEREGY